MHRIGPKEMGRTLGDLDPLFSGGKNMKKIIATLMVLMLLFGTVSYATPADVVGTDYESAVNRLMGLDLLMGYPDGTFKPTATITRAEFAAVVVRALGASDAAAMGGTTKFQDVPAGHWASGYISVASGMGVVKGYSATRFGPSDKVTYEQAVTMVVRALGYEPVIAAKGGYPAGYLVVASELGLLQGTTGKTGAPAPRGFVAMLVDNALEVPLMVQTAFGDTVRYVVSGTDGTTKQTLLANNLGLTAVDKRVTSVDLTKREILFDDDSTIYTAGAGLTLSLNLVDLDVTILVKGKVVHAIEIHSSILMDFIDGNRHSAAEVTLVNAGKTLKVTSGAISTLDDAVEDTPAFTGAAYDGAYGLFILNAEGEITSGKLITAFDRRGIIKAVTAQTLTYINVDSPIGAEVSLNAMDQAKFAFVGIDGTAGTIAGLKPGMLLEYDIDASGRYAIAATNKSIEDILNAAQVSLEAVTIGGKSYPLSGVVRFSEDSLKSIATITTATDLNDLFAKSVTAYHDASGEIVLITGLAANPSQTFYGILKEVNTFNEEAKVERIVDKGIKTLTYDYDLKTDAANLDGGHYVLPYDGALNPADFYQFILDDTGLLIEIKAVPGITDGSVSTTIDSVDEVSDSIYGNNMRRYFVDENLMIFSIDGGVVSTLTWGSMKASDITDGSIQMNLPVDTSLPEVILILDDANNELGTYLGDYILAYAPTAPVLSSGKYASTVKTMTGDLAVSLISSDLNGWYDGKTFLVLQMKSDGTYVVVDVATGDDFFLAGGLITLDDHYTDVVSVDAFAGNLTVINGTFLTIGGTVYKLASNTMIYRSLDDGATINSASANELQVTDTVTFVHLNGVIQLMIFKR